MVARLVLCQHMALPINKTTASSNSWMAKSAWSRTKVVLKLSEQQALRVWRIMLIGRTTPSKNNSSSNRIPTMARSSRCFKNHPHECNCLTVPIRIRAVCPTILRHRIRLEHPIWIGGVLAPTASLTFIRAQEHNRRVWHPNWLWPNNSNRPSLSNEPPRMTTKTSGRVLQLSTRARKALGTWSRRHRRFNSTKKSPRIIRLKGNHFFSVRVPLAKYLRSPYRPITSKSWMDNRRRVLKLPRSHISYHF